MKLTIADWITVSRLLLAFPLFYSIVVFNHFLFFTLLSLILISDIMDGWIARKINKPNNFGKLFDSFVDFFWINTSLIILAIKNLIPFYFFLIYLIPTFIFLRFRRKINKYKFLHELCPFAIVVPVAYLGLKILTGFILIIVSVIFLFKYLKILNLKKKSAKHS